MLSQRAITLAVIAIAVVSVLLVIRAGLNSDEDEVPPGAPLAGKTWDGKGDQGIF
jgi:hypothetical protein